MSPLPFIRKIGGHATNLLETGISVISPGWAANRMIARSNLVELARISANPQGAWKPANSADTASSEGSRGQRERVQMMWEAREIIQNFGFAKSIAMKFGNYVTGQIIYQADTDNPTINTIYEEYIGEWMENCDLTGRFPFRKLIELAYLGWKIDGDSGIVTPWVDDDIKIQVIQGDRIGNPHQYLMADNYYSGVITDEYGKPVAYRVFQRSRENFYRNPIDIPAANFHHLLNPLYTADQYRGITTMDTAIPSARLAMNTLNAEARAVQTLACQTAIVSTKGNSAGVAWDAKQREAQQQAANAPIPQNQEIKPGTINYVANGDNVTAFTYSRPSPAFTGLIQALMRDVCFSWNADYGFFYDPTGYGGAVARLGSKQTQRAFKSDQNALKENSICPLIRKKLALGIARGDIPAHPQWRKMQIQFPEHATMDEGRDSKQDIEELKYGVSLLDEIVGRNGGNIDNHLDRAGRIARKIIETAEKYDVPVTMIQQRTPNANEATEETPSETPKPPIKKTAKAEEGVDKELAALKAELMELREYVRDGKGQFASGSGARSGAFVVRGTGRSARIFFDPINKGRKSRKRSAAAKRGHSRAQFRKAVRQALTVAQVATAAAAVGYVSGSKLPRLSNQTRNALPPGVVIDV